MMKLLQSVGPSWGATVCAGREKRPCAPDGFQCCGARVTQERRRLGSSAPETVPAHLAEENSEERGHPQDGPLMQVSTKSQAELDDVNKDMDESQLFTLSSFDPGWDEGGDGPDPDDFDVDAYNDTLKKCATGLKESAKKERESIEDEIKKAPNEHKSDQDKAWSDKKNLMQTLRKAGQDSLIVADQIDEDKKQVGVAVGRKPTMKKAPAGADRSKQLVTMNTEDEPEQVFRSEAHATVKEEDHHSDDEDLDVEVRYERMAVASRVRIMREQMREEGTFNASSSPMADQVKRKHVLSKKALSGKDQEELDAKLSHVKSYQDTMRSKLVNIGVPNASREQFVKTAEPGQAVLDAVAKYHERCEKLGRFYAMPGDDSSGGIEAKDRQRLEHYIRDLKA